MNKDRDTGKYWFRSLRKFSNLNKCLGLFRVKEKVHRLITSKAILQRNEWVIYFKSDESPKAMKKTFGGSSIDAIKKFNDHDCSQKILYHKKKIICEENDVDDICKN